MNFKNDLFVTVNCKSILTQGINSVKIVSPLQLPSKEEEGSIVTWVVSRNGTKKRQNNPTKDVEMKPRLYIGNLDSPGSFKFFHYKHWVLSQKTGSLIYHSQLLPQQKAKCFIR
jgi:hypothetical protein